MCNLELLIEPCFNSSNLSNKPVVYSQCDKIDSVLVKLPVIYNVKR